MALRDGDTRVQYRRGDGGVFNIDPRSDMGRDWLRNNPGAVEIPRTERQSETGLVRTEVEAEGDVNAMNVSQLKRYAAEHEIDLTGAKTKGEILTKIVNAAPQDADADGDEDED